MEKSIADNKNPNEIQEGRILGVDWGKSKVGLALADEETKMAFAYTTLSNDKNFLQKLTDIIEKEKVEKIVIGIPSYVNKKETIYDGEKLGEWIKKTLPDVEVAYQNEMFTTKMAQKNLISEGMKNVAKHDDEEAARIILQSWIDTLGKR